MVHRLINNSKLEVGRCLGQPRVISLLSRQVALEAALELHRMFNSLALDRLILFHPLDRLRPLEPRRLRRLLVAVAMWLLHLVPLLLLRRRLGVLLPLLRWLVLLLRLGMPLQLQQLLLGTRPLQILSLGTHLLQGSDLALVATIVAVPMEMPHRAVMPFPLVLPVQS